MLAKERVCLSSIGAAGAVAIAIAVGPVGDADAAERACTAEDLEGARTPATLSHQSFATHDPLVAGTRYRVTVVQEDAIGTRGRAVDGSIAVSAPNGPALEPRTVDDRPVYDFTPAQAGTVRLVVTWDQQARDSGDVCSAVQTFDLPVLNAGPTA